MGSKTDSITESLSLAWRHESLPQKSPKQLSHRLVTREGGGSLVQCRPLVINVDHMVIQIITKIRQDVCASWWDGMGANHSYHL